ncbi:lysozyme inhibitor LprI family protein [Bordetella genomosp. 11]|nr:lysozyme inhibitor LprI family protein [Bordetella genomosp. 11]
MYGRLVGIIGMCFSGVLLSLGTTNIARAASFDCKKASGKVEHAICDDRNLDWLDQSMGLLYADARASSTDEAAAALRRDQVEWLKARNACVALPNGVDDCLKGQMQTRIAQLDDAKKRAQASLDRVLAKIPSDPVAAANALRRYHVGLSAAWMLYLHKFVPAAGVTAAEARQNLKIAQAALADEPNVSAIMEDMEKDKGANSGIYVLTMLRLHIERAGYEPPRAPVHCFIFARQDEAYDAFGPFYGSSQDAAAPICSPQGDLFEQPAWKTLAQAVNPALAKATPKQGTLRFSSFAQWNILALRATVSPRDFLKPPKGGAKDAAGDSPEQQIRDWTDNDSWPQAQRDQALAAVAATEKATAQWLQSQRGLSPDEAAKAAHAIVQEWLDQRVSYMQEAGGG